MSDSDQSIAEYLAGPGGGGAFLPPNVALPLNDALENVCGFQFAKQVQGLDAPTLVAIYNDHVPEEDRSAVAKLFIERWLSDAPAQKRPVQPKDVQKPGPKVDKGADDDDDEEPADLPASGDSRDEQKKSDLKMMGLKKGAQLTALDVSIYTGRMQTIADVVGEAYGKDAVSTVVGNLRRKEKQGDTFNELLDKGDTQGLGDLMHNLIREYNCAGSMAEAKVITSFWGETCETFGVDSKGLCTYLRAYRRKWRGRAFPLALDPALVIKTMKQTDASSLREEVSKISKAFDALSKSHNELKSKVGTLETSVQQLKTKVGSGSGNSSGKGGIAEHKCSHCGVIGEHWSNRCPNRNKSNSGVGGNGDTPAE